MDIRITIISFFISISSHTLLLAVPGFFHGAVPEEPKSIQIEIEVPCVLPKVKTIDIKKALRAEKEKNEIIPGKSYVHTEEPSKEDAAKKSTEATIHKKRSNNDQKEDVLRYQDMIKQRIQEVRKYPVWAVRQNIEGSVHLRFIVLADGMPEEIKILTVSGYRILDEEAVNTIKRASPFPKIPSHLNLSSLQIDVTIIFRLRSQ